MNQPTPQIAPQPVNVTLNIQSAAKTGPELAQELKYELSKLRFSL